MANYALPISNQGSWLPGTDVGVVGGIAQYQPGGASERTNLIDVTDPAYGADNTGIVDCSVAVAAAIAASSAGDVIWFPAGSYLVQDSILVDRNSDNITLRGAGSSTIMLVDNDECFNVDGGGSLYETDLSETVTGAKTKGTAVLGVASTSDFSVGDFWYVTIEDEKDPTRIEAGAPPTWAVRELGYVREVLVLITAIDPGVSVTIDTPLPIDCTNYDVVLTSRDVLNDRVANNVGIENLHFKPSGATHYSRCVDLHFTNSCWLSGCSFDFENDTSSRHCVRTWQSIRTELRRNVFHGATPTNSDGAVNYFNTSGALFEDNILSGDWNVGFYSSGGNVAGALLYNFMEGDGKSVFISHGENYDTLMLYEGGACVRAQADSFWGGSHYNTFFRNWIHSCDSDGTPSDGGVGLDYTLALGRFSRNYAVVGNVHGWDGNRSSEIRYGEPNLGNNTFDGYAGPTGNSTDPNASAGDYWDAWNITGTITTRTSDTEAVIETSDGTVFTANDVSHRIHIFWTGGHRSFCNVDSISVNEITVSDGAGVTGDVFPAVSTAVTINPGPASYQELDLDVEPSCEVVHNYESDAGGTGAVTDSTVDTLPDSMAYAAEPDWWGDEGFVGTWPPVNPDSPTFSVNIIPAGARYLGDPVPSTPPNAPTNLTLTAL